MGIAIGSLQALAHRVLGTFFLMLLGVVAARMLGVHEFGVYVSTTVVIAAGGSLAASFASATGYFVSNKGRPAAEVASNTILLAFAVGAVLFAAGLAVWYFASGQTAHLALLVGIALFPLIARYVISGVFIGEGRVVSYSLALYVHGYCAIVALLVWVVLLDHRTGADAVGSWIVAQYAALVLAALLAARWWSWLWRHRPDMQLITSVATFGTVTGLAGVVSFFNYRVDQLLVVWLDGEAGAGIYATAVVLAESLWLFSTAISVATYSRAGQLSRAEAAEMTTRGVRHTLIIAGAGGLLVFLLAPFLVEFLYGAKYGDAATSLRILCIGTAAYAPQAILSNYFTVTLGRPRISLSLALFSCLLNVAVSVSLIPALGYVGGAWATTISYAVTGAISTAYYLRISGSRFNDLWKVNKGDVMAYVDLFRSLLRRDVLGLVAGARTKP